MKRLLHGTNYQLCSCGGKSLLLSLSPHGIMRWQWLHACTCIATRKTRPSRRSPCRVCSTYDSFMRAQWRRACHESQSLALSGAPELCVGRFAASTDL